MRGERWMLCHVRQMYQCHASLHTLEELFACIFAEECFMRHWGCEIVHHQLEDGHDVFLCVASISDQCRVLQLSAQARHYILNTYPVTTLEY